MSRVLRIGFLSNCFVFGYRGVARRQTYPEVARRRLEAERPGLKITTVLSGLYHPADLPRQVARALDRHRLDILVLDASANRIAEDERQPVDHGALPAPLARLAEAARTGRSIAKGLVGDRRPFVTMIDALEQAGQFFVNHAGVPFVRRHSKPSIDDYERLLEAAIAQTSAHRSTTLIVQGPSAFNPDESHVVYAPPALDAYREVNAMVKRVTAAHRTIMVDRQDAVSGAGRAIFLGGQIRLSTAGHEIMGQALAEKMLESGLL